MRARHRSRQKATPYLTMVWTASRRWSVGHPAARHPNCGGSNHGDAPLIFVLQTLGVADRDEFGVPVNETREFVVLAITGAAAHGSCGPMKDSRHG